MFLIALYSGIAVSDVANLAQPQLQFLLVLLERFRTVLYGEEQHR